HALELFVAGHELFVGRGQIVVGARALFAERFEILPRRGQLVLELGRGANGAPLAFALALRLALRFAFDAVFEEHQEQRLLHVGDDDEWRNGEVALPAASLAGDEDLLASDDRLRLLRLRERHPYRRQQALARHLEQVVLRRTRGDLEIEASPSAELQDVALLVHQDAGRRVLTEEQPIDVFAEIHRRRRGSTSGG